MADEELGPRDVLFMGMGCTVGAWYRLYLPALALQADWIGYATRPPDINYVTGYVRGDLIDPVFQDYKVIVIQQPRGKPWLEWIVERQAEGIKVLYEIDDDLWSIAKMKTHTNQPRISQHLKEYEPCMRACDGIIASTPKLARKIAKFNHVYLCEVGIDMERYHLPRGTDNKPYTIGFAGGIGHEASLGPWLSAVKEVLSEGVRFINVGIDYTEFFPGQDALAIPFAQVEAWPSVLANFDVLLAPGGNNGFFKCKSELKWIEASALGIPVIADRIPYRSIVDGKTGLLVRHPDEVASLLAALIDNPQLGKDIGAAAQEHVVPRYHVANAVDSWIQAFEGVT